MRLGGLERDDKLPHYSIMPDSEQIQPTLSSPPTGEFNDTTVYNGSCKCGNIKYSVTGDPIFTSLCHCYRCRVADSSEYRVAATYDKTKFSSNIDSVDKSTYIAPLFGPGFEHLQYWRCTKCDTRCYHYNAKMEKYVVYPSTFEFARGDSNNIGGNLPEKWRPNAHIFYGSRLGGHDVDDGLIYYVGLRGQQQCDYKGNPISN